MDYIDLKKLTLEEMMGVVNIYPWFAGARLELSERLLKIDKGWAERYLSESSLYVADLSKIAALIRLDRKSDWADGDVAELLKTYIGEKVPEETGSQAEAPRRIQVLRGDYFTQEDYDKVRTEENDHVFSRYAAKAHKEAETIDCSESDKFDLYTETLAQIYAEQGYYDEAKEIYSKLILANPEKNTYFATLIGKLDQEIKN